jgi:nucleoside-triphosphatase THEP1
MKAAAEPSAPARMRIQTLLVAVIGDPGAGKTRLLAELAADRVSLGARVEGILAVAGPRAAPDKGAAEYRLRIIGYNAELPWARRDDSIEPPYVFDEETRRRLGAWAEGLQRTAPPHLVVLDEFGKFESRGEGLMPLWPALVAARPQIVVASVRRGLVEVIEWKLGRTFDVIIDASAPDALDRLRAICADYGEWTRLGLYGGAAGGIEMSAGAALHAAQVPLRGLAMSSVQAAMMTLAGQGMGRPGRVVWVPFISAGLKSLSPAGNRVRPMLAIVMQGLLFGGAVQALGWNFLSVTLGGALVGAWAAAQGVFLQYLMIGEDLVRSYDAVTRWLAANTPLTAPSLPVAIGLWALLHAGVAAAFAFTVHRLRRPPKMLQEVLDRELLPAQAGRAAPRRGWRRLAEFARWQFWLPLLVVMAIMRLTGGSWESLGWLLLRFVTVAAVLLAVLSLLKPAHWAEWLRARGWWGPSLAFASAMEKRARE